MLYKGLIRPALFALSQDDPERAHEILVKYARFLNKHPFLFRVLEWWHEAEKYSKPVTLAGITFPNQVGLSAGLDKTGVLSELMQAIGFGFITIGTVVPAPQPGNPRPRIARLPAYDALANWLGFNSPGMEAVIDNMQSRLRSLCVPVGISLGKNKDTPNDRAVDDYVQVYEAMRKNGVGDYYEVCVSSPNTPGLRDLQDPQELSKLLHALRTSREKYDTELWPRSRKSHPFFVKIAPDVGKLLPGILEVCQNMADGLIIGNTTIDRTLGIAWEQGGLSGPPIFYKMLEMVGQASTWGFTKPMIAVGGINSPARAQMALNEGAHLVQVLTALVYEGPGLPRTIKKYLARKR